MGVEVLVRAEDRGDDVLIAGAGFAGLSLAIALAAFGLINAAAVAGGAWFGPVLLRWPSAMRAQRELHIAHESPDQPPSQLHPAELTARAVGEL